MFKFSALAAMSVAAVLMMQTSDARAGYPYGHHHYSYGHVYAPPVGHYHGVPSYGYHSYPVRPVPVVPRYGCSPVVRPGYGYRGYPSHYGRSNGIYFRSGRISIGYRY